MQPFSFEFGDRYHRFGDWQLAFRVYTETNVYSPDPRALRVRKDGDRTILTANRFAWAGLQQTRPGKFEAEVWREGRELRWRIRASLPERIKGSSTYIRDLPRGEVVTNDFSLGKLAEGCNDLLQYPAGLKIPAYFLRHRAGEWTFAMSEDSEVRGKSFAVQFQGDRLLLELHHHEDARKWSTSHESPVWQLGRTADPRAILARRMKLMEEEWGLRPWEERADVPDWARKISLVLNLHGAHWTGFVFNDYARQLEIIRRVCRNIPGQHVLVFLAAWDGRYNFNWPRYEADDSMGGARGLQRLVEGARKLGVRVIPQVGAQSANRAFLPPALHDCAFQDAYGNTFAKPIEWDADRMPDTYRVNANIGHPGFRQFLFDKICGLKERYGFDGIFLDINMAFHNDPRFHVTEGHQALARSLQERFSDFLVFGESWYDGLLPAYPLVHTSNPPVHWNDIFEKYARTTYHLYHPAPGKGSTGVYELGHRKPFLPDPRLDIIPAISFVEDTLARHTMHMDQVIGIARRYGKRKGILRE